MRYRASYAWFSTVDLGVGIAFDSVTMTESLASAVPVPAALHLLAGGLGLMGLVCRRRRA